MAQTVLSSSIKEQIVCNALAKAGIPNRKAALRAARVAWAERVRLQAIGGAEVEAEIRKNLKKKLKHLPLNFLRR
ncbi:Nmad5 family putative nucleotide modification protein [Enterobacter sp.]